MKNDAIVLYPSLDRGHLLSMIELANLISTHHPSLSITLLLLTPPTPSPTLNQSLSAASPSVTLLHLPPPPLPSDIHPHILSIELCRRSNNNLHQLLLSISKTSNIKAVVLDFLNFTAAATVTNELNLPTFFYYTSGASSLCTMLHFPTLHETTTRSIKDLHTELQIPGIPRISSDDYPEVTKDRESFIYRVFLDIAKTMRDKSAGIIVNTFDAIEARAIRALTSKEVTKAPDLFCVGPLISSTCENDENGCLSWLDSQPSQSVVLLCFGSMGRFSKKQLMEIAMGLEKSKQRFLWVLRAEETESDDSELSLNELLPEGFLERTKEKGMVVRDWAPQVAILSHDSVGGFVTHCGWNSVLESVCEGVPMVAWPLYAEQKINRVVMVQEMKIALGVKEDEDGFVSATELGERVSELMDSERGKEIRQRIFKMRISAVEAKAEGGSFRVDLNRLVQLWKSTAST
ncbi:Isoflavone 7-O-glucosyltransferase 1 [Stylosanthes scabra]|uniref:Glycosyltransferase n=1 Tax=Stylosanthes scabra TaxID=79078 RepID=A0ABU6R3D8_9FABA|nr:Isoflavone 7-O-glucosyltransferase 1 [Stylosanthes scabra]